MSSKRVAFKKFVRSFTGFSMPVFGVSWNPPPDKRDLVRRLVAFLEDRRALYQPFHLENGPWVSESILAIRRELTEVLKFCPEEQILVDSLRAMRAACRKYLDTTDPNARRLHSPYGGDLMFASALGELRGVFGLHLSRLCLAFGIDVEEELAATFPIADQDSNNDKRK